MTWPKRRTWWWTPVLVLLIINPETISGQQRGVEYVPPTSLDDPRVQIFSRISQDWVARGGPRREVIDQVCLVPDVPTFFQAIATWDEGHYFPILLDDVETSFRFIRAFQPARVIRMPRSTDPIPIDQTWNKALAAVAASWSDETEPNGYRPEADKVPRGLGPTPPGVVFSSPDASMLPGAVALCAGRFQPLIRIDYPRKFAEILSIPEVESFAASLENKVKPLVNVYDRLGDDCDFLTVAGDWPYAYRDEQWHSCSVDDRIGRRSEPVVRWAYSGRLLGDAKQSVYRAMCSLFLQPDSALLFNGYAEDSTPWSIYTMKAAALRLNTVVRTALASGEKGGTVESWHEVFDPINRFGLILINSSGSPTDFAIRGGNGTTSDIPYSVPTAVLKIHSFSAANPLDSDTLAGRWLANGAFVYFGSMNEPFLQSFRPPNMVSDVISEHFPLVVAVRATHMEAYGKPWRLVFLGDPLYRIKPIADRKLPRAGTYAPTLSWPSYVEPARPSTATSVDLLYWALKASVSRLQRKAPRNSVGDDLIETILAIDRVKLPIAMKPIYDALLIDGLLEAKRRSVLKARLLQIPESERSSDVKRALSTLFAIDINHSVVKKDLPMARNTWRDLMRLNFATDLKVTATRRVGRLADSALQKEDWMSLLRSMLRERGKTPDAKDLTEELKRVEAEVKSER